MDFLLQNCLIMFCSSLNSHCMVVRMFVSLDDVAFLCSDVCWLFGHSAVQVFITRQVSQRDRDITNPPASFLVGL